MSDCVRDALLPAAPTFSGSSLVLNSGVPPFLLACPLLCFRSLSEASTKLSCPQAIYLAPQDFPRHTP